MNFIPHYRKVCECGLALNATSNKELDDLFRIHRENGDIHKIWEGRV